MRHLAILCLLAAGLAGAETGRAQSLQQYVAQCTGADDARVIVGCTGVIQSSQVNRANKAVAYVNRGNAYARQGDVEIAIADFSSAIRYNSRSMIAYYNRGNAYYGQQNYEQAIVDFSRAIALEPGHAMSYNNRGSVYLAMGDRKRALADFESALALDPDNAEAAANRALAYTKEGDIGGVLRNIGQVVKVFFRTLFGDR